MSATLTSETPPASLHAAPRYAVLSMAAAVTTIALKTLAWRLTNSVGLFSDAAESLVNLVAAAAAFWALRVAARPADDDHAFGHTKAEYLASGFEGLLILGAATGIALAGVERIVRPQPLEDVGLGLIVSTLASLVNGGVAWVLFRAGKRLRSITLRADAQHLLTDVWTSVGVIAGVILVKLTGWAILDPLIALLVATSIVFTGMRLVVETGHGLLDRAIPKEDREALAGVLHRYESRGVVFHAVRTRMAGPRRFVEMHVLVPGEWTVQRGHDLCEEVERDVAAELPLTTVLTHLEPVEDPVSWDDRALDRPTR